VWELRELRELGELGDLGLVHSRRAKEVCDHLNRFFESVSNLFRIFLFSIGFE
jgi:CelD/BcsL family acetyltransferase involved in cellulose biosynthesis